jgi:ethanolamine utilization protein EutA
MNIDSVKNMKQSVIGVTKEFFQKNFPEDASTLGMSFERTYLEMVQQHEEIDDSEVAGIRQLIVQFRPALSSVLGPCEEFDELMTMVMYMFKAVWDGANRRKKKPAPRKDGPTIPGSDPSINLTFYCTECELDFEIPDDLKSKILNGSQALDLPMHHGKEMKIRISKEKQEPTVDVVEEEEEEPVLPVELLMGHIPADKVEYMKVLSVGIDVGSSTSHLIFSRLTLRRELSFLNMSNRFYLVYRQIIYESPIIFTPLLDRYNIDIEALVEFFEGEYKKAGITPEMVETGAVIVTGETAKKTNAEEIVKRLSSESGKFVSAVAGVNLESLLSAMGSGIVVQSGLRQKTILHVDIGGGTSNLAIASMGQVLSTSCINVGGRLLGIDDDFKIWRIDGPTQFVMKELGMSYQIGDIIPEDDARLIAREYAIALVEVMQSPAKSTIAKELMMAEDLDFSIPIDEISFSGGVAEMFYGSEDSFDDIGKYLAEEIRILVEDLETPIVEPENKIRATVIGAGAFSLSISGSTTYYDENIDLPIENIPVLPVHLKNEEFNPEIFVEEINRAFMTFDMIEGKDTVALYFNDPILHADRFKVFAQAIEKALPNSVAKKKLIILIFGYDFAKVLGITIRDETSIKSNLLCLDELQLEAGDWIDVGAPLKSTQAFPITVKSLVFNENKEYS